MSAGFMIPRSNITAAQYRSQTGKKARRSKYNACRVVIDGLKFDSKREGMAWVRLRQMERAGEISNLRRQVPFQLWAASQDGGIVEPLCMYYADFVYLDKTGKKIVADSKGVLTKEFRLKAKMMKTCHGVEIELI